MNDIVPQRKHEPPKQPQLRQDDKPATIDEHLAQIDTSDIQTTHETATNQRASKRKKVLFILGGITAAIVAACVGVFVWYNIQLSPVDSNSKTTERVEIESGMGPKQIAQELYEKQLIRSQAAFTWFVNTQGVGGQLQAGTYALNQTQSLPEIVDHMVTGNTDSVSVTFYPGATLRDKTDTPAEEKTDIVSSLRRAGYAQSAIDAALDKAYDHPLFVDKPADADLEGYIYGETYEFPASATVEEIFERSFDEMYAVVTENNLKNLYKKHGLSLHEGIILASIVQREEAEAAQQKAVAGVFFNRIDKGMNLGSDPTYQYIADKMGVARDPNIDSPYNTRKYTGLPKGPIAVPGESALLAVATPQDNGFLYFLSGDDDKLYFGRTEAEHQRNITNHCREKCQIL